MRMCVCLADFSTALFHHAIRSAMFDLHARLTVLGDGKQFYFYFQSFFLCIVIPSVSQSNNHSVLRLLLYAAAAAVAASVTVQTGWQNLRGIAWMIKLPFCPIEIKLPMFRIRVFLLLLLLWFFGLVLLRLPLLESLLHKLVNLFVIFFVLLSHMSDVAAVWLLFFFADMHEKPPHRLKTDRLLIWIKNLTLRKHA